ncbi:YitT family protein [Paenibacillus thailandensis]|uniref:YitT family protein n=1 Tax=Paenibacillus thailandensis TaxID=393250 RepID=A0ABW5QUR8_9BACL
MFSVRKVIAVVIGSVLCSVGINFFLTPLRVLDGGLIGIALICNYLFKMKVGLVMLLCSLPIFVLAWRRSKDLVLNSINGLLLSSYAIDILAPYQYHFLYYIEWTPYTRAVLGGAIIGTGIGIMARYGTSTGGTDLLAHIIARYVPLNIGVIILLTDAFVVGIGSLLLEEETLLMSMLTITAGGVATSLCTLSSGNRH